MMWSTYFHLIYMHHTAVVGGNTNTPSPPKQTAKHGGIYTTSPCVYTHCCVYETVLTKPKPKPKPSLIRAALTLTL